MSKIDNIIEQVNQGIKRIDMSIARENPQTEEGRNNIEYYRRKKAELEYRIEELEAKKIGNNLAPKYGDGKYANAEYKETFDMLRVWYYSHFHQEPNFSPVPKWDMMFRDPTLWIPVNTYLVKGTIPFQIMFTDNYPTYKPNNTKSISIELPFDILSKVENEEYLRQMLELIKLYSGDNVNLVQGNGTSTRGMLSFIAEQQFPTYLTKENAYYGFFEDLCDNNVRNIIYIGNSMQKGVNPKTIARVQSEIIDLHRGLTTNENQTEESLEQSNEKIKRSIITISKNL